MPKDESVAEKWKEIIPGKITKTSVVCNLHFKDEDFVNEFKKRLIDIPHPVQSLATESKHELELIKCIAKRYLSIRLKTYAKEETLKIMGNRISMRQRLHNTILFSNV